ESVSDLLCAVAGRPHGQDDLDFTWIVLFQNVAHGGGEVAFLVQDRHDNRNGRPAHGHIHKIFTRSGKESGYVSAGIRCRNGTAYSGARDPLGDRPIPVDGTWRQHAVTGFSRSGRVVLPLWKSRRLGLLPRQRRAGWFGRTTGERGR